MTTLDKMILMRDINEILSNIDLLLDDEEQKEEIVDTLIGMKENLVGRKAKYSA